MVGPPQREGPVAAVEFAPLQSAVTRLTRDAQAYDAAYAQLASGTLTLTTTQRGQLDALLQGMEQKLTDEHGLPGRDWYRHFVYAPGALTGYGVKTLPAVREAIEGGRWDEANEYVGITAHVLGAYCERLEQATALLRGGH